MIEPDELRSWMSQVQDEETGVEDYDFLEEVVHGGSRNNGNNGLANVGAYLAIREEDGEITVDEELVQALDEKQAESGNGGRKRFRNIVYDAQTSKREGNTLYDKGIDGHSFLEELATEFENNADYDSLPLDNERILKDDTQNQNSNNSKGGDNSKMTDDLYDNQLRTLAGKLEETGEYSTEVVHAAARLEREADNVLDAAGDLIDEYRNTGINVQRGVQSWADEQQGKLQGANSALDGTTSEFEDFKNEYLSGDFGISDSAKDAFSDAAGYDITQDL